MRIEGNYEPSPWSPVADQVALFEATEGREGDTFGGRKVVVLTTVGARSGKVRKTPLMRVSDGTSYAVVASLGGAPDHPVWYHNVVARPEVVLQDGAVRRTYRARLAEGEEKARWWSLAVQAYPPYADYQASTERVIPLFVLDPLD